MLNDLSAERALLLAPIEADWRAAHVWTQKNVVCDLSSFTRIKGFECAGLSGATEVKPRRVSKQVNKQQYARHRDMLADRSLEPQPLAQVRENLRREDTT